MRFSNMLCYVCLMGFSLAVYGEDYKIKMTAVAEVGDKYLKISRGTSSEDMSISSGGQILSSNKLDFKAELEGIVTVLKIDDLKRAVKLKFVITKCLASYGDDPKKIEILQKDSEIIIENQNKRTVFLFHDKPLPPRLAKVLDLFFSIPHSRTTDDDLFAPKERKKVGDIWGINSAIAAKNLALTGMKVAPENVKGDVTLEKVAMVGKTKCLFLKATMDISRVGMPLPPGMVVKKSNMSAVFSGEFPVDPDVDYSDTLTSDKVFSMEMEAEGKPAPDKPLVKISMKMNKSTKDQVKPIK